jgi:hypothetical protein
MEEMKMEEMKMEENNIHELRLQKLLISTAKPLTKLSSDGFTPSRIGHHNTFGEKIKSN